MKLIKSLLIAASAVAVFSTVSAFAELTPDFDVTYTPATESTPALVSVAEDDLEGLKTTMGDQITVLVIPAGTTAEQIADTNIYYINQDSETAVLTNMGLKDLNTEVKQYEVWVGGTSGEIKKSLFSTETAPAYTLGDVNDDSVIDGSDASLVLQDFVGLISFNDTQKLAGDVNDDSTVDGSDASLILQLFVGLVSSFN